VKTSSDRTVCDMFSRFSHIKIPCENVSRFSDGVVGLGYSRSISLNASQTLAVECLLHPAAVGCVNLVVNAFDRVIHNGIVMHTLAYSAGIKRCDSFFLLHNHSGVYALHSCICLPGSNELIFIFSYFKAQQLRTYNSSAQVNLLRHVFKISQHSSHHVIACRAHDISDKCICITDSLGYQVCIALPVFELD